MVSYLLSQEELRDFIDRELEETISQEDVRSHIFKTVYNSLNPVGENNFSLPVREYYSHSVIINDLFLNGRAESLVDRGDSYLVLCGFFPEYVAGKKLSPGLDFFINKGQECYNYASSLMESRKEKTFEPSVLFKLSYTFPENINSLLHLMSNLSDEEMILEPRTYMIYNKQTGYRSKKQELVCPECSTTDINREMLENRVDLNESGLKLIK